MTKEHYLLAITSNTSTEMATNQFAVKIMTSAGCHTWLEKVSNQVRYLPSGMLPMTAVPAVIIMTENVNMSNLQDTTTHTDCRMSVAM